MPNGHNATPRFYHPALLLAACGVSAWFYADRPGVWWGVAAVAVAAERAGWAGLMMIQRSILFASLLACACAVAPPAPPTEDDVVRLEAAALAGQREAIRGLFELRARAHGPVTNVGVLEVSDMILGNCARLSPRIFLEALTIDRDFWRLDALLGNCGPELVDMFEAQAAELRARRAALLTVDAASLRETRDASLLELTRSIGRERHP